MKKLFAIFALCLMTLLGGGVSVFANAQSDVQTALTDYNNLTAQRGDLQRRVDNLTAQKNAVILEKEKAEAELVSWKKSLKEYEDWMKEYKDNSDIDSGMIAQQQKSMETVQSTITSLEEKIRFLPNKISTIDIDLKSAQDDLSDLDNKIARAKDKLEEAKKKLLDEEAAKEEEVKEEAKEPTAEPPLIGLDTTLLAGGELVTDNSAMGVNIDTFLRDLIPAIGRYVAMIVASLAILFIIIGGFRYLTAMGNEEKAQKGKLTVTMAIIALLLILFAYTIVSIVINFAAFRQAPPEPMPASITRGCNGEQDSIDLYKKSVSDPNQILSFTDKTQVDNLSKVKCETTMENISLDLAKYDAYDCVWQGGSHAFVEDEKNADNFAYYDALHLALESMLAININRATTVVTSSDDGTQSATDQINSSVDEKISGVSYKILSKQPYVKENGDFSYADYMIEVKFRAYYPVGEKEKDEWGNDTSYCKKVN